MRSKGVLTFCLVAAAVFAFSRSRAVGEDQVYGSLGVVAQVVADQLLDTLVAAQGQVSGEEQGLIKVTVGAGQGVFKGEKIEICSISGRVIGRIRVVEVLTDECWGEVVGLTEGSQVGQVARTAGPGTIAVAPLPDLGTGTESREGIEFAERLGQALQSKGHDFQIAIVERGGVRIAQVQEELGFQLSGLVDQETAKKVGKFVGADSIIVGNVQVVGGAFRANVHMIDVETGVWIASASWPPAPTFDRVENWSFEELELMGGLAVAWESFEGGYAVDASTAHTGRYSIRLWNPSNIPSFRANARQRVDLNQDRPRPIRFSGWSKAKDVTGEKDYEYSLWVDFHLMSGESWYRAIPFHLPFSTGTHDWEYLEGVVLPPEAVKTIYVCPVFRSHGGTVWYDDIGVEEYREWKPGDPIPKREHFLYGELPCDEPLPKQESPYYVVADAIIPQGKTLTIEPGVEIVFDTDCTLHVGGDIRAVGTEGQPVRFKSGQLPTPEGFRPAKGAIVFGLPGGGAGGGKDSVFERCLFENVSEPTR